MNSSSLKNRPTLTAIQLIRERIPGTPSLMSLEGRPRDEALSLRGAVSLSRKRSEAVPCAGLLILPNLNRRDNNI